MSKAVPENTFADNQGDCYEQGEIDQRYFVVKRKQRTAFSRASVVTIVIPFIYQMSKKAIFDTRLVFSCLKKYRRGGGNYGKTGKGLVIKE